MFQPIPEDKSACAATQKPCKVTVLILWHSTDEQPQVYKSTAARQKSGIYARSERFGL